MEPINLFIIVIGLIFVSPFLFVLTLFAMGALVALLEGVFGLFRKRK